MKSNLYIPKKLFVGFQKRKACFTGKLAYVIYEDDAGKKRKETSWNGWKDDSIPDLTLDNKPRSGYILNKGVHRHGDWGTGRHTIRVYDPRDFEFEISVENLCGILTHYDMNKREIIGELVLAWNGTELVLLPTESEAYQTSISYTQKQANNMSTKDYVVGHSYVLKKKPDILTYIGYYPWYDFDSCYYSNRTQKLVGKKHIFYNKESKRFETPPAKSLSHCVDQEIAEDFSLIAENLWSNTNFSQIVGIRFEEVPMQLPEVNNYWRGFGVVSEVNLNPARWKIARYRMLSGDDTIEHFGNTHCSLMVELGVKTIIDSCSDRCYAYRNIPIADIAKTTYNIYLILENGNEVKYDGYY